MILPTSMAAHVLFKLDPKALNVATLCMKTGIKKAQVESMLRLLVANGWAAETAGDTESTYAVTEWGVILRSLLRKKLSEAAQ